MGSAIARIKVGEHLANRLLVALSVTMFLALVLFLRSTDEITRQDLPLDPTAPMMIRTLETSPSSRPTWELLSERALDYGYDGRVELWETSYRMLSMLTASWPTARLGFVRGSFVHWEELDESQRSVVVDSAKLILSRPDLYAQYWTLVWYSLRDVQILAENAPDDPQIRMSLAELAVSTGEFDIYRSIRAELPELVARDLDKKRPSAETVIAHLVSVPQTSAYHGVMESYLGYLEHNIPRGTSVNEGYIRSFLVYALDHDIGPLWGFRDIALDRRTMEPPLLSRYALAVGNARLATIAEQDASDPYAAIWTPYRAERARFEATKGDVTAATAQLDFVRFEKRESPEFLEAQAIVAEAHGDTSRKVGSEQELLLFWGTFPGSPARWSDLCQRTICRGTSRAKVFAEDDSRFTLEIESIEADSTPPWVEVWVDGTLETESAIAGSTRLEVPVEGWGLHDVEVRIANPRTRNLGIRTVAIANLDQSSP